jgi:chromosomal replication initiator protein
VTSGVFTLPLFGIDTSNGDENRPAGESSWGFVAGPENALLRILIDAVACKPPQYNPITLCGPTGAGKSHLMLGVLNHFRTFEPQRKPWYLTGADFARQYARSVELDSLPELREKLDGSRLLIIDGLDEFASKPAVQHELLQTIDRSISSEAQLLFACQTPNSQWSCLPAGLRSRLEGGLIIPVAHPAAETREEIARRIGIELGVDLSPNGLPALGQFGKSTSCKTFRELKHSILHLASQPGTEKSVSNDGDAKPSSHSTAIRRISKTVARSFEIKLSELTGTSRRKTVVQARGVAIYLARTYLGVSFEQLGKSFGNRDHTTILHAYRKTIGLVECDLTLKQAIDRLSAALTADGVIGNSAIED